ncbi:P-type conjugative transfer protein TrbJ [Sphingosinicella sp. CPCC 101087]|uniref:P-type conjugative transfer protein TrbJ n=1 Tax=Sphingosinicella sp. CPCC 101087 TaxID=2497754 RepID=UPI00101B84A9|nr:P-type conjugative transfer protein TrbJ [Sphingosinicella sp. CPCC 101087]
MKKVLMTLALGAAAPLALTLPAAQAAAIPVFDATNYAQNLLQAARALEQINHQIQSLQNEAAMLQNMARNLERIDFPQLERVNAAMQRIDRLMGQAEGIDFRIDRLDERIRTLFPGAAERVLGGDQRVLEARARLEAAMAGYRQAMGVQAQVVENVREDGDLLAELVGRSQSAAGALQVSQAANQLLALSIKQQFQLQNLMATEFRGQAVERARRAQAEADGRAATRRFLGSGHAYTPSGD